ncbi:tetratricopeptide repeat protein [Marinicella meishanensis]|uniref:tetratricopeptide repeat protein n=1 Tax=Marinicella meishanensis TaxID=2873263 RepID=UPI001CBD6025|nr:tetratricopeptide repeat protein [Marinicella sp. NBU2979]
MTHKKSLVAELIERRVPQILGMYVAAVWLAVEIGEWMSERFAVPEQTSSYIFVIMIAFIPLVGLLAWGHGRPGKDKWTQKQLFFIPFNIAIAWFAVASFIKPEVSATEILSVVDAQTGEVKEFEVAKSGLNQKVTGFFWENNTGDEQWDWLSYGAMWLVSQDLLRSPIISIQTPYDSASILSQVRKQGYEDAVGEPLSLDLSIADDRNSQWMIKGEINHDGSKLSFEVSLYDVVTGALVTTITAAYDDWLLALDDVAEQIGTIILKQANIKPSLIPDLSIRDHVSKDAHAIEQVVNALNAVKFDNDFTVGIEALKTALASDESLAEAYVLLIDFYRAIGDFESAKQASEDALKLEYKLYQESVFKVKANYYAVNGEQAKAIRVLENWVKIYPDSADALGILGSNYIFMGNRLDDALAVFERLNELQEAGSGALVSQAKIYRLKGEKEKALKVLEKYQELENDKADPLLQMAEVYLQFGDIDAAYEKYDEASLMSFNDIDAELGLANIMAMRGQFDRSLAALDALLRKAETDQDRVKILTQKELVLYLTGQLRAAMEVLDEMRTAAASFMPPLQQTLMFGGKEVSYWANLNETEQALERLATMRDNTKPPFDGFLLIMERNVFELMGEQQKAQDALARFQQFLQEFQTTVYDQFVLSARAVDQRHVGEFAAAIQLHDQAINESQQSFLHLNSLYILDELKFQKAKTLHAAEQHEEALSILADILHRNPLFGQSMVLKAQVLLAMGDEAAAMAAIEQAKALWQTADPAYVEYQQLLILEQGLPADGG